jgi:hypothetical protein
MKTFDVNIYYSGFCGYKIDAEDEYEAIEKARNMDINQSELLSNLEAWKEADTVEEVR